MSEPLYRQLKDPVARKWFHHVWLMAHRYKYGWSQVFTGMPGAGKTMTAVKCAELLAKPGTFDVDKHVAFTPNEYLESLRNIEIGQPVVWSEMGIGLPSRKWYSLSNILIAEVIQTMRIKRPIVLMDVSDLSFIDIQARKLVFTFSEVKRWQDHPAQIWIYKITIDRKTGKILFIHPRIKVGGSIIKLEYIKIIAQPSKEVWEKIDRKQRIFKDRLESRARRTHELMLKDLGEKQITIYDLINKVSENRKMYMKDNNLNVYIIQTKLNISRHKAEQIKAMIDTMSIPPKV